MLLIGCSPERTSSARRTDPARVHVALARGMDLARAAPAPAVCTCHTRAAPHALLRLAPPITAVLHPTTADPVEVCATDGLHTGDLRTTP